VVLDAAGLNVRLEHFAAGVDATYVVVQRAGSAGPLPQAAEITIGYAPFVEGTTLIYDLTAAAMQGKARPFACDLRRDAERVYAVLPVQVEGIRIRAEAAPRRRQLAVEFLDAGGQRIAAALPLRLAITGSFGSPLDAFLATSRDGRLSVAVPESCGTAPWTVVVQSLLSDLHERATLGD
jgi:hypothetical protein